jgi:predicted metalloprotease with PDZ domain
VSTEIPLSLGAQYIERPIGVELTQITDGGAAQAAGLNPGDLLIAVDGIKLTSSKLAAQLAVFDEGDEIPISVFRRDELREQTLSIQEAPLTTCFLDIDDKADAAAAGRRELWFGN